MKARQVRINKNDVGVTFGNPYIVFISKDILRKIGIKKEDIVKLEFKGNRYIISKAKEITEFFNKEYIKDVHALFYAICYNFDDIPNELKEVVKEYIDKDSSLLIDKPEQLDSYLSKLRNFLNEKFWKGKKIIIGCGFFELFLKGKRDIENLIKTPLFQIDKPTFSSLIKGKYEIPISISKYDGKVISPTKVYFCSEDTLPTGIYKKDVIESIKNIEIFMPEGDYIIPSIFTVHGPLLIRPKSKSLENIVYKIKPKSVELVAFWFSAIKPGVNPVILYEIVKKMEKKYKFKTYQEDNMIIIEKGIAKIFFTYLPNKDKVIIQFSHFLEEERKKIISLIKKEIIPKIEAKIDRKLTFEEPIHYEMRYELQGSKWVLDTNVIYLEDLESILDFFIPNPILYNKTIVVPECVLYEINRKKDEKLSLHQKGIDNLSLLSVLSDWNFIKLEFPKSDQIFLACEKESIVNVEGVSKIKTSSAIIDSIILRHVDDQSTLVTRDQSLGVIALCTGKKAINPDAFIYDYNIEKYKKEVILELKKEIYQEVKSKELTYKDLINFVQRLLKEKGIFVENPKERKEEAEKFVKKMIKNGELIEIVSDDRVIYKKSEKRKVVFYFDLIQSIKKYIIKKKKEYYFKLDFLQKMRKRLGLSIDTLPKLEIILPKSLLLYAYQRNKRLYENIKILKNIKNSTLKWREIFNVIQPTKKLVEEELFKVCEEENCWLLTTKKEVEEIAKLRDIKEVEV